jgi:nucleoside-diphosphate-sugar epimerase
LFVCFFQRVVVTSSCAAVQSQDTFRNPQKYYGRIFGENDWNDESTLEEGAYRMSKSLAEHAAWEFSNQVEVTTVNPSFILGPPLSKR